MEKGFYWVKRLGAEWEVAQVFDKNTDYLHLCGAETSWHYSEFEAVIDNPIGAPGEMTTIQQHPKAYEYPVEPPRQGFEIRFVKNSAMQPGVGLLYLSDHDYQTISKKYEQG